MFSDLMSHQVSALLAGLLAINIVQFGLSCWRSRSHLEELERARQPKPAPAPTTTVSAEELSLIRDILELRTLTDLEFSTPLELLQGFLAKLALLTGFERASLYRLGELPASPLERIAMAGQPVSPSESTVWDQRELELVQRQLRCTSELLRLGADRGLDSRQSDPLRSLLVVPVPTSILGQGLLVLSSRKDVPRRGTDEELARWAAQFLPATFARARARVELEDRARRDALTQLANRHTFDQELQKFAAGGTLCALDCSLVLLDIDHFKAINDTYGHLAGDLVLREVAQVISQTLGRARVADRPLVARYGGEEFALLLPETSLAGAQRIAESVRMAVQRHRSTIGDTTIQVTASLGVSASAAHACEPVALIHAADQALYAAKRQGRNRVVSAEVLIRPPLERPAGSVERTTTAPLSA